MRSFPVAAVLLLIGFLSVGGTGCHNDCSVGQTRCSGAEVQTCVYDSEGHLSWSVPATCSSGETCEASSDRCPGLSLDVCGGASSTSVCENETTVMFCAMPDGENTPRVVSYSCGAGERCQTSSGISECAPAGECHEGAAECTSSRELRTCTNGSWRTSTCSDRCTDSIVGSYCTATVPLEKFSGTLLYEALVPNARLTNWSTGPTTFRGAGFLVISSNGTTLYDVVTTSAGAAPGSFSVKVPRVSSADDRIYVVAAAGDEMGGLAFAVANPAYGSAGERSIGSYLPSSSRLWSWSWKLDNLTPGQDLTIRLEHGSGAARVYENLAVAYARAHAEYGEPGLPLVVWLEYGTTWSCGTCFASWPVTASGATFGAQLWLSGDSGDQTYWSDAVVQHELGHWAMASYGVRPNEGGQHYLGKATFPGQAWSEGWATWLSSDIRDDPIYLDKQGGMFWVDISRHQYWTGPVVRPLATHPDGLLQKLDENEVAAMLWVISRSSRSASGALFTALASPRMTQSPFGRGYTRHTWSVDENYNFTSVVDTGESKPILADMLDALACHGFSRKVIDSATRPTLNYPYDSDRPVCQ